MAVFSVPHTFFEISLLLLSFGSVLAVLRPRGVPLAKKVFYDPSQKFSCLDGSGMFPFYFVNDDFCDCADGSDEPGTAACQNGIFNCMNHGHKPESIPSSRVNDGICDCCDTSDEYNSTADCLDNCKELGQNARSIAKILYDNFMKGNELRKSYINQGKEKKDKYKIHLEELQNEEQVALQVKIQKQDVKEKAEDSESLYLGKQRQLKEALEKKRAAEKQQLLEQQQQEEEEGKLAFKELDINRDGKLVPKELQAFSRFDYDHDGTVSDQEAKFYMHKREELTLEEFLSSGWKIVKPAYTINQALEEENEETSKSFTENTIQKTPDKEHKPLESSIDVNNHMDEIEKESIFKEAALARQEYAEANKVLQDIQAEIWNIKRQLNADFGSEDEFLVLENQCFDFIDKQYLYKFCPFDKVIQLLRPSKSETLIGIWDKWSGTEDNHYAKMKFSRGALCWNGPDRSAEVKLQCGLENKVLSVTEPSPCMYQIEFTTPALCKVVPSHIEETLNKGKIII